MGVIPSAQLLVSKAPFVDSISIVLGKNISMVVAIITSLVCIGTLNAWIITSSQISLGLAKDNLLPRVLTKKNKEGAPYLSVLISCLGMIPILILTKNENLASQIEYIIDFSVKSFLFVYTICGFAYLKLAMKNHNVKKMILAVFTLLFCAVMIFESSLESLLIATLFTVSGIFFVFVDNK